MVSCRPKILKMLRCFHAYQIDFGPRCIPLMLGTPETSTVQKEAKILGKPILFYSTDSGFYGPLTCSRYASFCG